MTENEAINLDKLIADTKALAKEKDTLARTFRGFKDYGNPKSTITSGAEKAQKEAEQYEQIAKIFEENQQYHAIGTVEECAHFKKMQHMADMAVEYCKKYEEIGTVEECREAREKQKAKKPIRNDSCTCPSCGTHNETIKKRRNTVAFDTVFCWHCGQAMEIKREE